MIRAVVVVCSMLLCSCMTRTPEDPTGNRGTYEPPTSPSIVIDNFRNAVIEKNTQNFMLCLADPSRSAFTFTFEPSAETGARYQAVFASWSITKERQAFLNLTSKLAADQAPQLSFSNAQVAFSSPDSLVWVAEYVLAAPLGLTSLPTTLSGTIALTIRPEQSGLWSIARWSDARRPSDTTEATWSLLKGQLSN